MSFDDNHSVDEHLEWSRVRALRELEFYEEERAKGHVTMGDPVHNAMASVASDLGKHRGTQDHPAIKGSMIALLFGEVKTPEQARAWIEREVR